MDVVEKEEAEIEQRGRYRLAIHQKVFLFEMPSARPHFQHRRARRKIVALAFRAGVTDGLAHGVPQIELPVDGILPRGRIGVFEIGHEHVGAGVQRVDDHLPLHRPGDLDAAVLQVGRNRRHRPFALPDVGRCGQEVG